MGKPKAVNYQVLLRSQHAEMYELLDEVVADHHEELVAATIGLAWQKAIKADKDGHLVLGRCVRIGALQREMVEFDFVIVLNREAWDSFSAEKRKALIDHELCHAAPALDKETGEQLKDEKGRAVWRTRKHDIEEFREVVERHGFYKADLEEFAESVLKAKQGTLALGAKA